jgi:glucuronoarabinoxylan endo-1,4-beta-xylanase
MDQGIKIRRRRTIIIPLLFLGALVVVLSLAPVFPVRAITINWDTTFQTIDGFGASATGYTGTFTADQADKFFSSAMGLGLSLLRIRAIAGTVDADCGCVANSTPYVCIAGSKSQMVSGDLQIAQLAAARGVRLFATPWSPPATMKSSGSYCTGGTLIGNPDNYTAYAADLASFPVLLNSKGLSIYAMSIQNEPDVENSAYDTCMWTGQQIHDFVPYLWNSLNVAGFANIKIAIPEEAGWTFQRMRPTMDDPVVAEKVGLILGHAYQTESPSGIPSMNGLHVWQTEVSSANSYDGSMADAITWAEYIHNYMTVGVNAWMYWMLDCGPRYFNQGNNMCLTDQRSNFAKRAYVLGHFAKFIRPGWQRIDVRNRGPLLVSAYRGQGRDFAIIAINRSRWLSRRQAFVLNGIASRSTPVTPWLTSASASLALQPAVSLSSSGTTFTYTIPANSVVTFKGEGDYQGFAR